MVDRDAITGDSGNLFCPRCKEELVCYEDSCLYCWYCCNVQYTFNGFVIGCMSKNEDKG